MRSSRLERRLIDLVVAAGEPGLLVAYTIFIHCSISRHRLELELSQSQADARTLLLGPHRHSIRLVLLDDFLLPVLKSDMDVLDPNAKIVHDPCHESFEIARLLLSLLLALLRFFVLLIHLLEFFFELLSQGYLGFLHVLLQKLSQFGLFVFVGGDILHRPLALLLWREYQE